jgi:tyrosine aminotransferase
MLLPRPGFPLCQVLGDYHGVGVRYYELLPDQGWEIDIPSLRAGIDENTCLILINNPSNPCGTVYSQAHLEKVLAVAEETRVPVVADEVYSKMSFGKPPYIACAEVTSKVPILSVCAMSKRWLAPGWRLGWVTLHDADDAFKKAGVYDALLKMCQVSLGPPGPIQAAVPSILRETPDAWYEGVLADLQESAEVCVQRGRSIPGLEVASEPQGAMYLMVRIVPGALRDIDGSVKFAGELLAEETVAVLPGECFEAPGFFRVVFAAPASALEEAWDRIEGFCKRRYQGATEKS